MSMQAIYERFPVKQSPLPKVATRLQPDPLPAMGRELPQASFPLGRAWFVAFVSGSEMYRAKDRNGRDYFPVERRINELSFETYVPVEVTKEYRRGKRVKRILPVLGPYVFVRFDRSRDNWGCLLNGRTEGVHTILGELDIPRRIPDGLIAALRRAEEAGAFGGEGLKPGDRIAAKKDGPFFDLVGRVMSASKNKRSKVLFDGLSYPVNVETCFLQKLR